MKRNVKLALLCACLTIAPAALAQKLDLKLDALAARAKEHDVVDLNADQLKGMAALGGKQKSGKIQNVEGVQVYSFKFEKDGEYSEADLAPIRKQLEAPGWTRIVSSKSKKESSDIYIMNRDGKTAGIAIISAEPRELTVVNVVGSAGLDELGELVQSQVKYDLSQLKPPQNKAGAGNR